MQKIKFSEDWKSKIDDKEVVFLLECLSDRKSIKLGGYANRERTIEANEIHDMLMKIEKIDEVKLIDKRKGTVTITNKELIYWIDLSIFFDAIKNIRTPIKESNGRPESTFKMFLKNGAYELIRKLKNKGVPDKFLFDFLNAKTDGLGGYKSEKIDFLFSLPSFRQALAEYGRNLKTKK